ncbi:hypothetical protein [Desulfovibrio sp. DV]|uniref:hypothetical protein n=1 Tax=Desulfovibrio sp. DV TaxID=1844708 RepID=UPI00158815DA|nr:hypothetical protein [Desulfovibrio sp. DV]
MNKYGKRAGLDFENMVKAKDSMTGKAYLPYGGYLPSPPDSTGKPLDDLAAGYALTMITYKAVTQTKKRTSGDDWRKAPYPGNFVEFSAADAARLGFQAGDAVKIVSASKPAAPKFSSGQLLLRQRSACVGGVESVSALCPTAEGCETWRISVWFWRLSTGDSHPV